MYKLKYYTLKEEAALGTYNDIINFIVQENQFLTNLASIVAIAASLSVLGVIYSVTRKIWISVRKKYIRPDWLSEKEVRRYTKIYIKTRLQTHDADRLEDKKSSYNINKFIKKHLINGYEQYHWVLGESGMGKTAFLINLYFFYNCRMFKKYNVFFVSLRNNDAIDQIRKIANETDTKKAILLLDAFDESRVASQNYSLAKKLFEEETKNFCKVVFSCRTHFFNSSKEEEKALSIDVTRDVMLEDEQAVKHYICLFTNMEIGLYLIKRYGFKINKIIQSKKAIDKSPNLMIRPLLLSFIDDIILDGVSYKFSYQIYSNLINKWIARELQFVKKTIDKNFSSNYSKSFWGFVYDIAELMLKNRNASNEYSISYKDLNFLCNKYNIEEEISKRPRTLLNRVRDDVFQFAHQSIFEFLLADGVRAGHALFQGEDINITALDQYKLFLYEMYLDNQLNGIINTESRIISDTIEKILIGHEKNDISCAILDIFRKTLSFKGLAKTVTIAQLKQFMSTLQEHNFSKYQILLAADGIKPELEKACVVLFQEAHFLIKNNKLKGRILFDIGSSQILLERQHGQSVEYWDNNLFVDEMPIGIATEFIIEQQNIRDCNDTVIRELGLQNEDLTIEATLGNQNEVK